VAVAVASVDTPSRAVSDDNDNAALSGGWRSKRKTQVILPDKYASFADVFSEEKAS